LRKIAILGAVLIFIVVSPTYLGVSSLSQLQPSLLKVTTAQEVKTIEILGKNVLTLTTTRIEEWTNGTKLRMVFYHLLNPSNSSIDSKVATSLAVSEKFSKPREYYGMNSTPPREVIITYTKWISNTTTRTEKTSRIESASIRPLTGVYYPYTDWIDGLKFVLEGEYNEVFATYDHDDNYNDDGYYPLQENTPFILQGDTKPYHVHLIKDLLNSWVAGNISEALAVAASFFVYESIEELIEMGLAGASEKIAAILGSPIVVAVLVIWDIVDTIMTLLEILGLISQAQWVEECVREHFLGDGWAWRGPIARSKFIGWIWCPFWFKAITGWGWYQHREFDQTWGTEEIFGDPHHYTVDWYWKTQWKTAPVSATIDGAGKYVATSPWG